MESSKAWHVYEISIPGLGVYVGSTGNIAHRIRQHRHLIKAGRHCYPLSLIEKPEDLYVAVLMSFDSQDDAVEAERFACEQPKCMNQKIPTSFLDGSRRCSRCRSDKPLGEFPRSSWGVRGLYNMCKECSRVKSRTLTPEQRERKRKYNHERYYRLKEAARVGVESR